MLEESDLSTSQMIGVDTLHSAETTIDRTDNGSVREYDEHIESLLKPRQFIDGDGSAHTSYTFCSASADPVEVVFFNPGELPPVSTELLSGKVGIVCGSKQDAAPDGDWQTVLEEIRSQSAQPKDITLLRTVLFVATDREHLTDLMLRLGAGEAVQQLKNHFNWGTSFPDVKEFNRVFATLPVLTDAISQLSSTNDHHHLGVAKLILSYLNPIFSPQIRLESRFPSLFLLAHMPEVEDMCIQNMQEGRLRVSVKSKDGYELKYVLRPPVQEDFNGGQRAFDEAVSTDQLIVEEWTICGMDGVDHDVMQILQVVAPSNPHGKRPTIVIDTQLRQASSTDWAAIKDLSYMPGGNPDLELIRTQTVFCQKDSSGKSTVALAVPEINTMCLRLPIGDLSLDLAGHESGHLWDSQFENGDDEIKAWLASIDRATEIKRGKEQALWQWWDLQERAFSPNNVPDEIFLELERRRENISLEYEEVSKTAPSKIGILIHEERKANAIWRNWLKKNPTLRNKRRRTRDTMRFALSSYQGRRGNLGEKLDKRYSPTKEEQKKRWDSLQKRVRQIMGNEELET
ncbi:MAG: hypothetical protein COY80_04890 [Candidatus Pacebacteria bacterium CG_4_10_14_0_8_um_filter_42_14]|nr:MAG: hypothetical protein COY80_04890 [Candidatus Pacebacteria bacterium CG_4_10_14_0_8_um_filter_42_14]